MAGLVRLPVSMFGLRISQGFGYHLVTTRPLYRNPSATLGGRNHAAVHSKEIRISPQISAQTTHNPVSVCSESAFRNSHLDFSQFSFGFLGTWAVCNFPCSNFSASPKGLKKLGRTIEWHAVIQLSEAEKVSINFPPSPRFLPLDSGNSGLNVRPAEWVGGRQMGETFVVDAL